MDSGHINIEKIERIMKKICENKLVPTYSINIFAKGKYWPRSLNIYKIDRL